MFSLKGTIEPQSVSPELIGTFPVVPERPEEKLLRQDKCYGVKQTCTSAAANYGYVMLQNSSENSLVICETLRAYDNGGVAMVVVVTLGNTTTGTGPITVGALDTRLGIVHTGKAQAGEVYYGHSAAISGMQIVQEIVATGSNYNLPQHVVLAPGDHIKIWHATANTILTANVMWRERLAEPGELNL